MFNLLNSIIISAAVLLASIIISGKVSNKKGTIDAYYNTQGSFAGFVQKKNGLIRACEFSSHGTILSCSKWFEGKSLKQGKNYGIQEEEI